ncbi:hypothetical protein HLRTI_001315 [Halorhabdus tiamatea SARL4B]|uniref:Uncharacterized protein n=1 Tax=Halorhabdus tiamatea SARL4B TaxID=1033806 RepID=U2FE90_9EURY|nr:hypothetical protein [Halorhabdus tiamatea]ERJ06609.1 hypothetical protein HLRTI_001315 [Halorhabdus tiamatea SARL4B]
MIEKIYCWVFGHPEEAVTPYVDPVGDEVWVEINCPRCGHKRTFFDSFSDLDEQTVYLSGDRPEPGKEN